MKKLPKHILLLVALMVPLAGFTQTDPGFYDYPHNHLPWYTIESEHFLIHFQEGNSRSAQVVARIAEEIYGPVTNLYRHHPDEKVSIVLKDREDYSNGAAYFFDNKIDIWLSALDTPLRGTHNWLRNVITHEFVHIIQIQKGMKRKRAFPVSYLQWLSYEDVRRPDVLYGFPNGIVTHPFASVNIPAWFAEGTAQYQRVGLLYDTWDSHRDMILRTRILNDSYLSLEEMGTFSSKNSLEREVVYNQGFAFVIYLVNRFGEDVLRTITEALARKGTYTISEAIEWATGITGEQVFDDWIAERRSFYTNAVSGIETTGSVSIESAGFYNFFPKESPKGDAIAYLSNRGRDHGSLSLYLKRGEHTEEVATLFKTRNESASYHVSDLEPVIRHINGGYSFSPDGSKISYSVIKKTSYGELYNDIYLYDLNSGDHIRLTNGKRIQSPSWSPDGKNLAAIQYEEGTQNLVLIDTVNGHLTRLTRYKNGETIFTPAWSPDGTFIYFSFADRQQRTIMRYELSSGEYELVAGDTFADYRDPFISNDGFLYFSSNPDGIFNIYRKNLSGGETEKLTSVIGGAFMPFQGLDGKLLFSEFQADGYKIKQRLLPSEKMQLGYYDPQSEAMEGPGANVSDYLLRLNDFDDSDISAFTTTEKAAADTGSYRFELQTLNGKESLVYKEYTDTFTRFSFYPIIRFDNYTKLNGNNGTLIKNGKLARLGENLLRDVKPGVYFTSRDVLDRWSIFGGLLLGVGSRPAESAAALISPGNIVDMDRDIFLIAEHRGLPFIRKSWSPTVSVELYNLHRNVQNGLEIEEFACTSCDIPDTLQVDIAYEIWEASLFFRSKLSRRSLLELGLSYSPYRIEVDNFYSNELQTSIPSTSSEYFRGSSLSAAYTFDYYEFTRNADIAPTGLKGYLRYQYEPARLLDDYELRDGSLQPVFKSSRNHSAELQMRYGFDLPNEQALQARVRGFSYLNDTGDSFYADYIGGFLGMRSYPYFALAGEQTAFASLSWFLPLKTRIAQQAGPYTIDKIYARFFLEAGNAWKSPYSTGNNIKTGIGSELRVALNGYYLFPLKFFVSGSYGFNQFSLTLPREFLTESQSNRVSYGREFLFHFGLTFDFELL